MSRQPPCQEREEALTIAGGAGSREGLVVTTVF
jgi:hypothetical protein